MKTLRATALSFIIIAALFLTGCGPLSVIEAGLEGLEIYITEARNDGEIVSAKAELMIADTRQALRVIDALDYDLKIAKGAVDEKKMQIAAVRTALRGWNEIYARGNFLEVNETVTRFVRITNRALLALEAYYAARAGESSPTAPGARAPKSEKELKGELDEAIKELEEVRKELKPEKSDHEL